MVGNKITKLWYENSFREAGLKAQRNYPNEELVRFLSRNYFHLPFEARKQVKILEVGSGSLGNLKMIAREGFDTHGIDISDEAINLSIQAFDELGLTGSFYCGDMKNLDFFKNNSLDAIVDVFSSYCLQENDFAFFLKSVFAKTKNGGRLFLFTPSIKSDAFKINKPAKLIDKYTLDGIHRVTSPFYGNFYPFRFESGESLERKLVFTGFKIDYLETFTRSYNGRKEIFEWITVYASKN